MDAELKEYLQGMETCVAQQVERVMDIRIEASEQRMMGIVEGRLNKLDIDNIAGLAS